MVRPRGWIIDAILYVNRTGCAWRMMPHDFPPWDTVYWYFQRWNADGGKLVLEQARMKMPSIVKAWADGGYAGKLVDFARQRLQLVLEIVKKPADQHTFEALPRRWVVERTLSWLVRCRRLGHDYERLPAHAEAMVKWAMIGLMARHLEPPPGRRPWHPGTAR